MSDDGLFPGFRTDIFDAGDAAIFYRRAGRGRPLLCLHGFPQTGAMWAPLARALASSGADFELVIPDLRGYGRSRGPSGDGPEEAAAYAKRAMAGDLIKLMRALGHERFFVAGHDRGGRVGYRMALDHPELVERLAVLDILPTAEYWDRCGDRAFALKIYHWAFLAQPAPLPETLIGAAPDFYIDDKLSRWSARGDLSAFEPAALEAYRDNARHPERLRAMCDDYRAGAGIDVAHDHAARAEGRTVRCPMLALWGDAGIAASAEAEGPLDVWRRWADRVEGRPVDSGHFLPEENPDATLSAMMSLFRN